MRCPCLATIALFLSSFLNAAAPPGTAFSLIWSDEFNSAAGAPPDPTKWNFDLGNGGWGNGEIENYTSSSANAFQDGKGNLIIRAVRDSQGNYSSARLQTGGPAASTHTADLSWQYGRIEARMKLPFGKGVWPAFWMLGENIASAPWPRCGEIDIMENFGTFANNAGVNNGTAHGPGYSGAGGLSAAYYLPFGRKVYDDYHVYAIEWSENSISWFVDGVSYKTITPSSLPPNTSWVFNSNFFILLNLAVGGPGTFLGTPDNSVTFPQDLLVDYVRVYQATPVATSTPVISPGGVVNAGSYLDGISPGSLATLYGNNLTTATQSPLNPDGSFPTTAAGVTVTVNGAAAALTYLSPTQINFQVPWEASPGVAVPVQVIRNNAASEAESLTIPSVASPSVFLSEFANGVAWMTGSTMDGCATVMSECSPQAGANYQLWANGLGPKTSALRDGVVAPPAALSVPGGPGACALTIGGRAAAVLYCGAAPTEIIDQVNFTYPAGVPATSPYVDATLTVSGVTGRFRLPAPGR